MHVLHVLNLVSLLVVSQSLPDIVSVPDLHGDYGNTVKILEDAGLMDSSTGTWIGGSTTLVQTGDIVDRGPDSGRIYQLFARLSAEAEAKGGKVINLLGNHELMNIQGDIRYVNPDEMVSIGGPSKWHAMWRPDSELGRQVRKFKAVAKVGPLLFVHAGLLPAFLNNGHTLEDVNRDMTAVVSGHGLPMMNEALRKYVDPINGPQWTRFYSMPKDPEARCQVVQKVLEKVGANRMVVGHTPQQRDDNTFRVNAVCGGSLILADTAVSRSYGGAMSYIRYTDSGNEAVVHYPGTGMKEILPTAPLHAGSSKNLMKGLRLPLDKDKAPWLSNRLATTMLLTALFFLLLFLGLLYCVRPCMELKWSRKSRMSY